MSNVLNSKSLVDQRIVVTRSAQQAPHFCQKLEAHGATAIAFPVIQFKSLPPEPLTTALQQLDSYDWLLFTSGNAVQFFLANTTVPITEANVAIAASGSVTAKLLQERQITPDFIPDTFVGEALIAGLGDLKGKRILLPRAKIGRPKIAELIRQQGGYVDDIPLYDTVTAVPTPTALQQLRQGINVLTFTSPSSVRNFLKIAAKHNLSSNLISQALIAVIGPITADAAREKGLTATIMPNEYTIDALTQAIVTHYKQST